MNLAPEKVVKTRSSSDGYTSEIYTFDAWVNFNLIWLGIIIITISAIAPFISLMIFVLNCLNAHRLKRYNWFSFISMAASIYFYIDIKYNWILSSLVTIFFTGEKLHKIVLLNIDMIFSHLVLFLFSPDIYKIANKNVFTFCVYMLLITAGCHFVIKAIF